MRRLFWQRRRPGGPSPAGAIGRPRPVRAAYRRLIGLSARPSPLGRHRRRHTLYASSGATSDRGDGDLTVADLCSARTEIQSQVRPLGGAKLVKGPMPNKRAHARVPHKHKLPGGPTIFWERTQIHSQKIKMNKNVRL